MAAREIFNTVWSYQQIAREQLFDCVYGPTYTWRNGMRETAGEPGLGVSLGADEDRPKAYLPYNRLADGTVHDW